jgi:hypothetical protein
MNCIWPIRPVAELNAMMASDVPAACFVLRPAN